MINIFTDGSCRNNGYENSVGAWGYIAFDGDEELHREAGYELGTTNQRMELMGIIKACQWAQTRFIDAPFEPITIYTDSAYAHNCYTKKWYMSWLSKDWLNSKKEPVANRDLWEQLIYYFDLANFDFVKVKGHSISVKNNMVDNMVQQLSEEHK